MEKIKMFMYFFVLSGVFGVSGIYLRENFNIPFTTLSSMDVVRIVMIGVIQLSCIYLAIDTYLRFNELPKGIKRIIIFIALPSSIVYFLFLIGVYVE
ncbi:hypothetical protein [Alkalihalobacillus sp. CinArs1]|uniref:hypothetical protein n=1 Tax=Alkalihalobacillus sp. CinArs1 TaxID=2995314 RepID=UPI0022DDDE5E|nr:hypothetical protein [Alkalihalobacillus sp. CinArs1]